MTKLYGVEIPEQITVAVLRGILKYLPEDTYTCHALVDYLTKHGDSISGVSETEAAWVGLLRAFGINIHGSGFSDDCANDWKPHICNLFLKDYSTSKDRRVALVQRLIKKLETGR